MSVTDLILLGVAGLLAGAVNTAAGGGTLISFPALVALGLPPLTANVTSAVGLLPGYLGGAVAYRRELRGQGARFLRLGVVCAVGGVAGAFLLLSTPAATFEAAVPFLVLISCLLLFVQPRLAAVVARARERRGVDGQRVGAATQGGVFVAGVYGSYFGAGLGVLLLAVTGIFIQDTLQRLNALKALLSCVIVTTGAVVYLASGHVEWLHVLVLLVSSLVGGLSGGTLARRISSDALRTTVCVLGVVVALAMLVT